MSNTKPTLQKRDEKRKEKKRKYSYEENNQIAVTMQFDATRESEGGL